MNLTKDVAELAISLSYKTMNVGLINLNFNRKDRMKPYIFYGDDRGESIYEAVREETLNDLITNLSDALDGAMRLKRMYDSGQLKYGENLEAEE